MKLTKEEEHKLFYRYNEFVAKISKETGIDWLEIRDWIRRFENRLNVKQKQFKKALEKHNEGVKRKNQATTD